MTLPGIFILLPLVMACDAARNGHYNYTDDVEFLSYDTYPQPTIKDAVELVRLAGQRLRAALDSQDAQLRRPGLVGAGRNINLADMQKYFRNYTSGPGRGVNCVPGWTYGDCSNTTTTEQATTLQNELEQAVPTPLSNYPPAAKTNSSG